MLGFRRVKLTVKIDIIKAGGETFFRILENGVPWEGKGLVREGHAGVGLLFDTANEAFYIYVDTCLKDNKFLDVREIVFLT